MRKVEKVIETKDDLFGNKVKIGDIVAYNDSQGSLAIGRIKKFSLTGFSILQMKGDGTFSNVACHRKKVVRKISKDDFLK